MEWFTSRPDGGHLPEMWARETLRLRALVLAERGQLTRLVTLPALMQPVQT